MPVYFIIPVQGDAVKIGYTSGTAEERLRQLQTGCHEQLVVTHVIPEGTRHLEKHFHTLFATERLKGEWFTYEPVVGKYVRNEKRKEMMMEKFMKERVKTNAEENG
jgi:hypothetical protein